MHIRRRDFKIIAFMFLSSFFLEFYIKDDVSIPGVCWEDR